jgi:hypothetical protein
MKMLSSGVSRLVSLLLFLQLKGNLKNEIDHIEAANEFPTVKLSDALMETYCLKSRLLISLIVEQYRIRIKICPRVLRVPIADWDLEHARDQLEVS